MDMGGGRPADRLDPFNLADYHNSAYPDSAFHYNVTVYNVQHETLMQTTSYTGLVAIPGTNDVLVSYDRLFNAGRPIPFPENLTRSHVAFTVRLTIERQGQQGPPE